MEKIISIFFIYVIVLSFMMVMMMVSIILILIAVVSIVFSLHSGMVYISERKHSTATRN